MGGNYMKVTTKVQKDPETGECYLNLEDFKDFLDISLVKYYEVTQYENSFGVKFYDSNRNEIKAVSKRKQTVDIIANWAKPEILQDVYNNNYVDWADNLLYTLESEYKIKFGGKNDN